MSNFTPAQEEAVFCNASEILVSAAAGSGKTAVLTQRILRHISEGVALDRLLVVTFTEAASAEMRERVTKLLLENEKLAHQAALLPTADISTIHAFCRKLVKENFQEVEVDPAFRVGDDAELSLVKSLVMDTLFEEEYSRDGNEDFLDLVDVFGGKTTDERLDTLVRKIYNFMESDPFPLEAAKRYAAVFDGIQSIDETPWADIAREELTLGLEGVLEGLRQAIEICNAPGGPYKYVNKLQAETEIVRDLLEQCSTVDKMQPVEFEFRKESSFDAMYDAFSKVKWGTLPRISANDQVDPALKERVQRIRNKAVKERVKKLAQGIFFAPPEKTTADLKALAPRVSALMRLATRFYEEYTKEKRTRNIMDFSDLEHFAIRILYPNGPEDMTPAPIMQKYHEVLIDEYQDSNEVQDLILSAVAERRFMVGDVKQSIYRFRRANPDLFRRKYEEAKPYSGEVGGSPVRIDLSYNFRSRPEVLDAVNFFFLQLMSREVGDMDYDNNAALHPGHAEYPQVKNPHMWVELLDQSEEISDEETETDDEPISNIIAETCILAKCINELIATRKVWDEEKKEFRECRQGDIAILTRSVSNIAGEVIKELKNHGIDAIADTNKGFFSRQEIKTAVAFLRVTDNPRQDIDLITVLSSPVYAFSADELFEIIHSPSGNKHEGAGDFYDKITAVAAEVSALAQKAQKFLQDLEKWRSAAIEMPISRLIGFIYDSTCYPAHVANMSDTATCQANLRLLLERAIEFEETSLKGLFQFIRYIERLSAMGNVSSAAEPSLSENNDKVRLMTIHKSKGLEFPIVICAFLAKKFNTDDERRPVILHSAEGVGMYYVNTALRTRSNTLARFALSRLTRRENLSEELRCLYVAMTRAKELLILTGRAKNLEKSMEKWADHLGNKQAALPIYYRRSVTSYLDWIVPCLLRRCEEAEALFRIRTHKGNESFFNSLGDSLPNPHFFFGKKKQKTLTLEGVHLRESECLENVMSQGALYPCGGIGGSTPKGLASLSPCEVLCERTALAVCKRGSTPRSLPSKLSISEIKRLYDITPDSSFRETSAPTFEPPAFIKAESGITPMSIGSALHKITEHNDYNRHTTPKAIEELIISLTEKNLLTPEEAAAIDRKKIEKLANSPLAERLRKAAARSKLYRETPFVLALPATQLYPTLENAENETILVHGIIDCHFEEKGKIILLDFKSDNIPKSMPLTAWAKTHHTQLDIYKQALTKSTKMEVTETLIYSFSRGETVAL